MSLNEIKGFLAPLMARVETRLDTSLRSDIALLDATNRSLRENSGKMLRPMLGLLVGGACGKVNEDTVRYAAASELLHNATLLHDDVVDGAAVRRGLPTVASLLSSPAAVLIGDYWLVRCMQAILDAGRHSERVLRIYAKTLADLAEGELLQMQKASSGDTTETDYLRIIYSKTASLFEASALSAAISVDAPDVVRESAGCFARNLGLAFQIKDDIFDYGASEAEVGKPVGIDLQEQKITLPLLCALETVPEAEAAEVRKKVAGILDHPELAAEVREFVLSHEGVPLACRKLDDYIGQALTCLERLPETVERQYLAELAHYVGDRTR
jgi:octaprenyl-diphosphate synthase